MHYIPVSVKPALPNEQHIWQLFHSFLKIPMELEMIIQLNFSWHTLGIRFTIKHNKNFSIHIFRTVKASSGRSHLYDMHRYIEKFLLCFIVKPIPSVSQVYLQCFTFHHHPSQSIIFSEYYSDWMFKLTALMSTDFYKDSCNIRH